MTEVALSCPQHFLGRFDLRLERRELRPGIVHLLLHAYFQALNFPGALQGLTGSNAGGAGGFELRLHGVESRFAFVEALLRKTDDFGHLPRPVVVQLGVCHRRFRRPHLRFGRGKATFRLLDAQPLLCVEVELVLGVLQRQPSVLFGCFRRGQLRLRHIHFAAGGIHGLGRETTVRSVQLPGVLQRLTGALLSRLSLSQRRFRLGDLFRPAPG